MNYKLLALTAIVFCILLSSQARAVRNSGKPILSNTVFVAFDLETTGLSPTKNRVLEIGCVKFRGNSPLESTNWLINPEAEIPEFVQSIHHITPEMLAESPTFAEIYPEFAAFCQEHTLLAHNASFDVRFMRSEIKRNALTPMDNIIIDSLPIARDYFPKADSHSLEALLSYLGIQEARFHRAKADSFHIFTLMQKIEGKDPLLSLPRLLELGRPRTFHLD